MSLEGQHIGRYVLLQKTERESPVAFMPGMNRRSFEGGGDESEAAAVDNDQRVCYD